MPLSRREMIYLAGWSALGLGTTPLLAGCADNATPTGAPPTTLPATTAFPPALPAPTTLATSTRPIPTATPALPAVQPVFKAIRPSAEQVGRYNKFELTIDLQAAYNNPFDPAQVDLQATFSGPKGVVVTVPGFYWQDFTSQLNGSKESLIPNGNPTWKVRFSPTEVGQWTYTVSVVTTGGMAHSTPARLEVIPSNNPGYLRVSQQDPAYLEFSSNQPYFAVGQNVGWAGAGGTQDYVKWFGAMGSHGANYARVWMASWGFGIEWSDGELGNYSQRLDRAWQLDRVFELAEQNGLYVMLSLLNHGAFNTSTNPEWAKNPYNAALGGPCANPADFASDQQARELFKRRLRYIAARWGYSTHLLAWEWWNEVDFTPLSNRTLLKPWLEEMTAALQGWDGLPHLKTISYAKTADEVIYALPQLDFVQRHEYSPKDPLNTFPDNMENLRAFKKPALYGEFGNSGDGADATLDKTGLHLHNGQWAALMTKGFGTSMSWWWDNYIDPLNLYPLFNEQTAFLQGENLAAAHYQPSRAKASFLGYAALTLQSDKRILGWVKSDTYAYAEVKRQYEKFVGDGRQKTSSFAPEFPALNGASLMLINLTPGAYRVEWWDTHGQGLLQTSQATATGPTLQLAVPTFNQDLAFKLILES